MTTSVNWTPIRRDNLGEGSFFDITTSIVTLSWEPDGSATALFDDDLTAGQIIDVAFRMGTKDDAEGTLMGGGLAGMVANQAYTETGYADPVNTIPQVQALSGQVNDLWRLLMGPLADLPLP